MKDWNVTIIDIMTMTQGSLFMAVSSVPSFEVVKKIFQRKFYVLYIVQGKLIYAINRLFLVKQVAIITDVMLWDLNQQKSKGFQAPCSVEGLLPRSYCGLVVLYLGCLKIGRFRLLGWQNIQNCLVYEDSFPT